MKGVYYYEDRLEITFMWLFDDGRVLFIGKHKKQHQFVYDIFTKESPELNFSCGKFILISVNQIRMLVNDEHGKVIVKGEILDESTIKLAIMSRETKFVDKKIFHRYSEYEYQICITYNGNIINTLKSSQDVMKFLNQVNMTYWCN